MKTIENTSQPFDLEPAIGPLEEETLMALEEMDTAYAAWSAQRAELGRLYERVLSAWLQPNMEIDFHERGKRETCLVNASVSSGNARGTHTFNIVSAPRVDVAVDGDPELSYWTCDAIPISEKTGKYMSGRPSGAVRKDATVTLRGRVFITTQGQDLVGPEYRQASRDEFERMVARAEAILYERENPTFYPAQDHSAHNSAIASKKARF